MTVACSPVRVRVGVDRYWVPVWHVVRVAPLRIGAERPAQPVRSSGLLGRPRSSVRSSQCPRENERVVVPGITGFRR